MTLFRADDGAVQARLGWAEHLKVGVTVLASVVAIFAGFWIFGDSLFGKLRGVDANTRAVAELTEITRNLVMVVDRVQSMDTRTREWMQSELHSHSQEERLERVQFSEWTKGQLQVMENKLNTLANAYATRK